MDLPVLQTNVQLQLGVEQMSQRSGWLFWIVLIAVFIGVVALGYYLHRLLRRTEHVAVPKAQQRGSVQIALPEEPRARSAEAPKALPQTPALSPEVEKHLKEDERIVLRVLQMKGGSTTQGTLRVATNFSKARLSRILTELEQRGIIHKDREGKRNAVSLRV